MNIQPGFGYYRCSGSQSDYYFAYLYVSLGNWVLRLNHNHQLDLYKSDYFIRWYNDIQDTNCECTLLKIDVQ